MEISSIELWIDMQKAIFDLLIEKEVITLREVKNKILEYHSLTEEKLDEILTKGWKK